MIWCNCLWHWTFRFCHQYTDIIWLMTWCNSVWHWTFRFYHQYTGICHKQLHQIISQIIPVYWWQNLKVNCHKQLHQIITHIIPVCNSVWHWTFRFYHQYTGIIWLMTWCNCLIHWTFRFCHQYTGIIWLMTWCNCLRHWTFRFITSNHYPYNTCILVTKSESQLS
jgi:hypothetical protein